MLPIWRRCQLVETHWEITDQAFALHGLITGIALSLVGATPHPPTVDDPLKVLSAAVTALLGSERASKEQIRSAAGGIRQYLERGQASILQLIG